MPRDRRRATAAVAEAQASTEGQRECARGQWCASRTVTVVNGERVTQAALGYQAFCVRDEALISDCIREMPGLWLRVEHELAQPSVTETHVHVPFGPSVPVRLDADAAMRLTAVRLCIWEARVRAAAGRVTRNPYAPVVDAKAVRDAAGMLRKDQNLSVLLALRDGWMTVNVPLRPGRHGQPASIGDDVLEQHGEEEIIRVGADFAGLFTQRDGAGAGLEMLHLHYWCRAVLSETPARPEELLGVECRSRDCSALALRRAEPAWHRGDPDYYSECAVCGDLCTEEEYRLWVGQLAAYQRARLAAIPVLAAAPVP